MVHVSPLNFIWCLNTEKRLVWYGNTHVSLFHNSFSHTSKQPEQHILAHKPEQPTAGCIAIFHKYCCYIKHGGIITNLILWNPWGYVIDMVKYRIAGKWIMDYNIITFYHYIQKHMVSLAVCSGRPPGSRQAVRGTANLWDSLLGQHWSR